MADPALLKNAAIYLGGFDLSGKSNAVQLEARRAELTSYVFGDDADCKYPGLMAIDAMVKGRWNAGVGEIDAIVDPRLVTNPDKSSWPLTIAPPFAPVETPGADGNIAYTVRTAQFAYRMWGQHGELIPFDLTSRIREPGTSLYRQTVVLPKATYAATTTGTGRQLGVLGATQKLVTVLHVFSINGGSWVLTVESDDNGGFASPTTRQTFTAVTAAPGRLVVETVGPIATDDFWRVVLSKTGGTSIVAAALTSLEPI